MLVEISSRIRQVIDFSVSVSGGKKNVKSANSHKSTFLLTEIISQNLHFYFSTYFTQIYAF